MEENEAPDEINFDDCESMTNKSRRIEEVMDKYQVEEVMDEY